MAFLSVWASCAQCNLVWRSSLLETVVGYFSRGIRLVRDFKVVARYKACHEPAVELQQPPASLRPVSVDRVTAWLASQERSSAPLLPKPAMQIVVNDFYALDDIQLSATAAAHIQEPPVDEPPVEPPADRALANVEDLYEAFKRLELQLGTISDSLQTYSPHP